MLVYKLWDNQCLLEVSEDLNVWHTHLAHMDVSGWFKDLNRGHLCP